MMYDEVDRHHNRKQALSMNVEDDEAADSEDDSALLDDEAAVFDVAAEDESTSEEEDDEEALEEEIERGGRTGQSKPVLSLSWSATTRPLPTEASAVSPGLLAGRR